MNKILTFVGSVFGDEGSIFDATLRIGYTFDYLLSLIGINHSANGGYYYDKNRK